MKLQEIAFMLNLIKSNYRRRMFWFVFAIIALVPGIVLIVSPTLSIDSVWGVISVMVLPTSLIILIFHYSIDGDNFPWQLRKRELKALWEGRKTNFEELICSVPLKKYFEI